MFSQEQKNFHRPSDIQPTIIARNRYVTNFEGEVPSRRLKVPLNEVHQGGISPLIVKDRTKQGTQIWKSSNRDIRFIGKMKKTSLMFGLI